MMKRCGSKMNVVLRPVILPASQCLFLKNGPEKVKYLGELAREALRRSAAISDAPYPSFSKTPEGVPIPEMGWHWSISHKPGVVAGVIARAPTGIDVEHIRPVRPELYERICDQREWGLSTDPPTLRFFRYWTAKEAVLKAVGLGFQGLSDCRIQTIQDSLRMGLQFSEDPWRVEHLFLSGHLVAVASRSENVVWTIGALV